MVTHVTPGSTGEKLTMKVLSKVDGKPQTVFSSVDLEQHVTGEFYTVGQDIRDYHKRKRKGELLPHTAFRQFSSEATSVPGARAFRHKPRKEELWLSPAWWRPPSLISENEVGSYMTDDHQQFVQQAAAQIYASGHDTLTMLSELVKVRSMFKGLATRFLRMVRESKRRSKANYRKRRTKLENATDDINQIAKDWLEGRYGWRTLWFDIVQLNKVLTDLGSYERSRYSQRAGTSHSFSETVLDRVVDNGPTRDHEVIIDSVEVSVRGNVTADINVSAFRFNALLTTYEIIPFSFIVDWVVDIGTALEAASFLAVSRKYVASYGYDINVTRQYTNNFVGVTDASVYDVHDSEWSYTTRGHLQVRNPTSVQLYPSTGLRLNRYKVLDLVSLIVGEVISRRR